MQGVHERRAAKSPGRPRAVHGTPSFPTIVSTPDLVERPVVQSHCMMPVTWGCDRPGAALVKRRGCSCRWQLWVQRQLLTGVMLPAPARLPVVVSSRRNRSAPMGIHPQVHQRKAEGMIPNPTWVDPDSNRSRTPVRFTFQWAGICRSPPTCRPGCARPARDGARATCLSPV